MIRFLLAAVAAGSLAAAAPAQFLGRQNYNFGYSPFGGGMGFNYGGFNWMYYQTREFLPAGYNYAAIERCDEHAYRRLRHTAVRRHDILVSCAGVGGGTSERVRRPTPRAR